MGEMPELALIRVIVEDELPKCFELLNIDLTYDPVVPPWGSFKVVIRIRKKDEHEEEPLGWGHRLASRIRNRWAAKDLAIAVHEVSEL